MHALFDIGFVLFLVLLVIRKSVRRSRRLRHKQRGKGTPGTWAREEAARSPGSKVRGPTGASHFPLTAGRAGERGGGGIVTGSVVYCFYWRSGSQGGLGGGAPDSGGDRWRDNDREGEGAGEVVAMALLVGAPWVPFGRAEGASDERRRANAFSI